MIKNPIPNDKLSDFVSILLDTHVQNIALCILGKYFGILLYKKYCEWRRSAFLFSPMDGSRYVYEAGMSM